MWLRLVASGLLVSLSVTCQLGSEASDPALSITASDLRRHIEVLAADSMRGRGSPSHELEQTANYVAGQFQAVGLTPLGDANSYEQRFVLEENVVDPTGSGIAIADGEQYTLGDEVQLRNNHNAPRVVTGQTVVLTGRYSDSTDFGEMSLGDAAVLLVHEAGPDEDFDTTLAATLNPLMIGPDPPAIVIISDRSESEIVGLASNLENVAIEPSWRVQQFVNHAVLEMSGATLAPVLARHGFDLTAAQATPNQQLSATRLPDLEITVTTNRRTLRRHSVPNVVGLLEGSDPTLMDEYLVVVGHMDHVGTGTADAEGDSIFNGADDNATGTAAVLELAEALSQVDKRPRRSILFLATGAEELGLFGSNYFAANPPVPLEQIVGVVNIDMIGAAWWPDSVPVIGKLDSTLGEAVDSANGKHPELGLTPIEIAPPRLNYRIGSDHYSFVLHDIPAVFFSTSGPTDYYHQRSDEADLVDTEFEERVVKLIFYSVLEMANQDERPRWRGGVTADGVARGDNAHQR